MLIKQADDISAHIDALRRIAEHAAGTPASNAQRELRNRTAGLRGERESAYLIDFHFAQSPNWAVIHDLRVEHGGRCAQIDHLLINRRLDVYVLESKHFHAGLKITPEGEFLRWNDFRKTYEGMPSPLAQNDRHIIVLQDVFSTLQLPTRIGLRLTPSFHSLVLVSPNARIDSVGFDRSQVIKADQLRDRIDKDFNRSNSGLLGTIGTLSRIVSPQTVEALAHALVRLHVPAPPPKRTGVPSDIADTNNDASTPTPVCGSETMLPLSDVAECANPDNPERPAVQPETDESSSELAPACKKCAGSSGLIQHGQYGYYFKCQACSTNTSIRFRCLPGHKPRLRKAGNQFHRDCAQCATSVLFHVNVETAA